MRIHKNSKVRLSMLGSLAIIALATRATGLVGLVIQCAMRFKESHHRLGEGLEALLLEVGQPFARV